MRSWRTAAAAIGAILLAAGHLYYWYAPRWREATPSAQALTARLFSTADAPMKVWVAFPHQNFGAFERLTGGALADLTHRSNLPRFGPFAVPPSRALVVASDEDAHRVTLAADVYPLVSWVARAAGRVASNPWLCGGTWEEGGRTVRVRWEGGSWIAELSGGWSLDSTATVDLSQSAASALFERGGSSAGEGQVAVRRGGRGLVFEPVSMDGGSPPSVASALQWTPATSLVGLERDTEGAPWLWTLEPKAGSLPRVAVAASSREALPDLPGGLLFDLVDLELAEYAVGSWWVRASHDEAGRRLADLVGQVDESWSRSSSPLRRAIWARGGPSLKEWRQALSGWADLSEDLDRWLQTVVVADSLGVTRLVLIEVGPTEIWGAVDFARRKGPPPALENGAPIDTPAGFQ